MTVWAIADLHLSFGVSNKHMHIFGPQWENHAQKIEKNWRTLVAEEDLVLIPGDISWALHIEEVQPDLEWIGRLPGTKVMIKGNHDFWWNSLSKLKSVVPPSCHLIQNNSWHWQDIAIAGTRLWDVPGLNFHEIIDFKVQDREAILTQVDKSSDSEKIYHRELGRLEASLKSMDPHAKTRIVMTHYPPIGITLEETDVSKMLKKYKVDICIFGHLHNIKPGLNLFGKHNGICYILTACDYHDHFKPIKIYPNPD